MDGVLVIDKPAGPTSHDIVQMVKRIIGAKKVGHLGTLDPAATGVLPLVIDGATKFAGQLAGIEKVYEFTLNLGITTDTDDDTGNIIERRDAPRELIAKLMEILPEFTGQIMQRPPDFSAVKVGGRRAYKKARKGGEVKLEPRQVTVDSLEIIEDSWPSVRMRVACKSGTYVRSLARDMGERLGVGGHASLIRRLKSGRFSVSDAVGMEELKQNQQLWRERFLSLKNLFTPCT